MKVHKEQANSIASRQNQAYRGIMHTLLKTCNPFKVLTRRALEPDREREACKRDIRASGITK